MHSPPPIQPTVEDFGVEGLGDNLGHTEDFTQSLHDIANNTDDETSSESDADPTACEAPSAIPNVRAVNSAFKLVCDLIILKAYLTNLIFKHQSTGRKCTSPIYHFYEIVPLDVAGKQGEDGDVHYRCFHGGRKIITVTAKAKGATQSTSY